MAVVHIVVVARIVVELDDMQGIGPDTVVVVVDTEAEPVVLGT